MKYCIKTYGCQMNKSDSERIASLLESAGLYGTSEESDANLIVMNVCSVRQTAVDRIFGNVKKYRKIKKYKPYFKTVITGCVLPRDRDKFENMFDLVIDIKEIDKIFDKLGIVIENDRLSNFESYFDIDPKHQSKITAYVPIMTGCNNFCSYCVVPYVRGREYSRPAEEIINEISVLVENGYKEIILLGQNVNSYSSKCQMSNSSCHSALDAESTVAHNSSIRNNPNNKSNPINWIPASMPSGRHGAGMTQTVYFPTLLKLINAIPGEFWIRFLTSHPKDMTEELIKTVSECEKCTEYMHLALQSGDNEILKNMNRKYTAKHFLALIELIRKYMPDAAITTDVIVGFPGEAEEQFRHTADVMKKAQFDMVYVNKYSPREGTVSSRMPNDVSWDEKKRREKILTEILKETALENNKKYIGKTIDILAEKINDEFIYGKTRTFKNVKIQNPPQSPFAKGEEKCAKKIPPFEKGGLGGIFLQPGQFAKIKITRAGAWGLEGEVA